LVLNHRAFCLPGDFLGFRGYRTKKHKFKLVFEWAVGFNPKLIFMKLNKILVLAAGILSALAFNLRAQDSTNVVTVTNYVTVTVLVTNVVSITNTPTPTQVAAAKTAAVAAAVAAAPKAAVPAKYPWNSTLTAGLSLTRGNSHTLLATVKVTTDRKTPINEYTGEGDASYGSANGVENSQQFHGFGQWNHLFSERSYGFLRSEGLHDGIADIKYRITLSAGYGYYFLKETNTTLAGELGPGAVLERVGEVDNSYASMRVAERFEHKFGASGARVWQTAEYLPQVDKWSDYLFNFELGAEAPIARNLSLSACLDDNYNSEPASGRVRNDVKLVSGITYKF
jgi:putative salt-induced outer membrane protein YdiY